CNLPFWPCRDKDKAWGPKLQNLADAGHRDLGGMALHRGGELARVLVEKIEGSIMAGDHGLEIEETLDRERRHPPAHGEAVADRDQADFRRINLRDEPHVGENTGVAHVVETG